MLWTLVHVVYMIITNIDYYNERNQAYMSIYFSLLIEDLAAIATTLKKENNTKRRQKRNKKGEQESFFFDYYTKFCLISNNINTGQELKNFFKNLLPTN